MAVDDQAVSSVIEIGSDDSKSMDESDKPMEVVQNVESLPTKSPARSKLAGNTKGVSSPAASPAATKSPKASANAAEKRRNFYFSFFKQKNRVDNLRNENREFRNGIY
jgi:hypothetical protein